MGSRAYPLLFAVLALSGCRGAESGTFEDELEVPIRRELYPVAAGVPVSNFAVTKSSCASTGDDGYECVVEWVGGQGSKPKNATATLTCEDRSCVGYWTWGRAIAFSLPE